MNDKITIFFLFLIISFIAVAGAFFTYAWNNEAVHTISACTTSWVILESESRYMWVWSSSWAQTKHYACDTNDILVCTWYQTGIILSACNVWSSVSGTGKKSNGMYFQFWRNKGFYYQSWATYQDTLISSDIWMHVGNDRYGFINNYFYDWVTSWLSWYNGKINDNWGYKDSWNIEKQWPCANGYHIPTFEEMNTILKTNTSILNYFPKAWLIKWETWSSTHELIHVNNQVWSYWITTQEKKYGSILNQFALNIRPNNEIEMMNYDPGYWLSIHCFKNLGDENISYTNEKIKIPFFQFKKAFQEYFEVDSINYFKKFWKTYQLVPVIEQPILLEDNIWMFQDYQEKLKNDVIYKKWWKYFYSNGWYYFVRIK